MSYWVFTDIFEESAPRFTPFHGGFGLMNYQGIKKPAYYAYSFLNKLGETELTNTDSSSWACKSQKGDLQVLFWDYTYTHPGDSVLNQTFYARDLPSKTKGKISVEINNIPRGSYTLEIYRIGYRINDAYSEYLSIGKPKQLTKQQVETLKQKNNGLPISTETVVINGKQHFRREIIINENDVYLLGFKKQ
jgi:xylan 1,4-beta-xylosidase